MTQEVCNSFKVELFKAQHNFSASGGHTFKVALYTSSATLNKGTTAYSATNEVSSAGYTAGGFSLTNVEPSVSNDTLMIDFSPDPTWVGVTFTTSQGLIYNSSASNKAVLTLDFGGNHSVTAGDFLLTLPPATSTTALLRVT